MGFIYAIILIGVLVFVHEFGHFIAAKLFKVNVLQFAIGFGPNIVSFEYGGTEYCIKAFPLGGHVMMQGNVLEEVEELPEEERQGSLMAKPVWQRAIIALAGPLANIIFPVIIYFFMALTVSMAQPAIIGEVFADMPAANAGLKAGDRITEINGKTITYWQDLQSIIAANPKVELPITYMRHDQAIHSKITPQSSFQTDSLGLSHRTFGLIGVTYASYGPLIAVPNHDSIAAQAGLKTFDRVVAVDGEKITRYDELVKRLETLSANATDGASAKLLVLRPIPIHVGWGTAYRNDILTLTLPLSKDGAKDLYGLDSAQMYVSLVNDDTPAATAGMEVGDKIVSVNGKPFHNWGRVTSVITNDVNAQIVKASKEGKEPEKVELPFQLGLIRDGAPVTVTIIPGIRKIDKQEAYRVILGFEGMGEYTQPDPVPFPWVDRIPAAAVGAVTETWSMIKVTSSAVWGMISGRFGLDNLGGPIMIGNLAAKAGDAGIKPFLNMMSLISINLALMNLLPIPMFDGGHLVIYLIEAVQRRPISFRTRQIISYVGIVLILLLFVLAFKNDIERSWEDIVIWINNL